MTFEIIFRNILKYIINNDNGNKNNEFISSTLMKYKRIYNKLVLNRSIEIKTENIFQYKNIINKLMNIVISDSNYKLTFGGKNDFIYFFDNKLSTKEQDKYYSIVNKFASNNMEHILTYVYIPLICLDNILSNVTRLYTYHYETMKINIYTTNSSDINEMINHIVLNFIFLKTSDKKITVILFDCDVKKNICDDDIFKKVNVNSGYTMFSEPLIVIYRTEEYKKLVIHELIHIFGIDKNFKSEKYTREALHYINIENHDTQNNPSELYTETLANILNIVSKEAIINGTEDSVIRLLFFERAFSIIQFVKILNHSNIKMIEELYNKKSGKKIKQRINVLYYYILRSVIMFDLTLFYNIVIKNIQISVKDSDILFTHVLNTILHNKEYKNLINTSLKTYKYIDEPQYNTLMMTMVL